VPLKPTVNSSLPYLPTLLEFGETDVIVGNANKEFEASMRIIKVEK
jgi:hypothetical protein